MRNFFLNNEGRLKEYFRPGVQEIEISTNNQKLTINRSEFFQFSPYWIKPSENDLYPVNWMRTNDVSHPVRHNPEKNTSLYERYIYEINRTIVFRVIDPARDLAVFSSWQNNGRVSEYWELAGTPEKHLEYIKKNLADPHLIPAMLEVDGEPVGYFEFYWTKEDRLGPYYDSHDYDRGFHFLIGERKFLGIKNTDAVLKCVVHYLFLDDPRTLKIMAEPRSDNRKVLQYVDSFPVWKRIKEFSFPHKHAVLLECTRERLFTGGHL
ncbi:N2-citryl-N6-acetyl-N6-hydroxylysine synthase/acetyl CoA:N6-hydroxylysine acetyl transferase [Nitrosomonas aestuarii]|uniref:N2-citryl-N6-acetyl-N6-hydroxylysine synthase/acetyl CoA:N6-hydroxylysine acetyl transferase n=1 Tax=Nitrosomonas aestuarii TaxID=52441 RepID=A0A1I3ZEZ1_9PROT|nr:GNAT family N-acetyltransferase [Nitrosomonas aestuarii]SFK42704.1 N2-citryl-N6-acetyl-N6-hydroxylysine synthase/acetyl CoA:N6-hydroxylysine acetyl transferase [Nitrosomonas aestuarii]